MVEEDLPQLVAIGIAIHLLILNNLSHLGLFLGEELVNLRAGIGLHFADNGLIDKICQYRGNILLDSCLAGINLRHQQCDHIVDSGRELLLIFFLQIAYHEEDIDDTTIESLFLLIFNHIKCLTCVLESTLSQVLHGALHHSTKELVKRNELTDFHFLCVTGYRVSDIDE